MADVDDASNDADAGRRTRQPSLASSDDTDFFEDAVAGNEDRIKKPRTTSPVASSSYPSPSRGTAGRVLEQPPPRRRKPPGTSRRSRSVRMLQKWCRALPVLTPTCGGRPFQLQAGGCAFVGASSPSRLQSSPHLVAPSSGTWTSSRRRVVTGTLFGYRGGRVALALQDNARCLPELVVELALQTRALLRELGGRSSGGGARIVLECEKRAAGDGEGWVLEEPVWTMYCNGRRVGYAVRREPSDDDIEVLETLWAVSMGGGVLPGFAADEDDDGEMAYMRGSFEHTVGSRDSESLYMVAPPGGDCPEHAIFFVRL